MATQAEQMAAGLTMSNFAQATDLQKRIWFTLGALIIFRLLSYVPLPGIDPIAMADVFQRNQGGVLDLFNSFSGGALQRMSIIAVGVMPYITASIVVQLSTSLSPSMNTLKKEGESGRKKLNQYTRYLTVLLTAIYGFSVASALLASHTATGQSVAYQGGILFYISTITALVGGTMFLMWLGEQITSRGIGNGI
ncbi:MAG: preprotein translocase subunit SecY, partial [Alphaproteobacteria bacterium]|nr:preprotein translocase subunit SecY [Alphaproteobacteria bacterium]